MPIRLDVKLQSRESLAKRSVDLERENASLRADVNRAAESEQTARRAAHEAWAFARSMTHGPRPRVPDPQDVRAGHAVQPRPRQRRSLPRHEA